MPQFLFLLILVTTGFSLEASDLAKEKRWAEQIEEGLLDGEIVMLNDGKHDFVSIYTPAQKEKETAVILLHGIGVHPDWPQVINPLRVSLPEKGWSTLSLQLPVLPNEAEAKEYQPLMKEVPGRINAAVKYLQESGFKNAIIVAHSMGAEMASYYLAQKTPPVLIKGYIGIGMTKGNTKYLPSINLPILDLYGENDLKIILTSAAARAQAASNNKDYTLKKASGADHFFIDQENLLLEITTDWLNKH